ncbi:MAG: substrate-binding domain-containing protein [Victivallales bacterium]|nr:substrate-binding domain-containing protein [Victivallales bacterium]
MSSFKTRHPNIDIGIKLFLQAVIILLLFYLLACGMFVIGFGLVRKALPLLCWGVFCLGAFLCSVGVLWRGRKMRRVSYALMLLAVVVAGGIWCHFWWTEGRFPVVEQQVAWWQYRPYAENNKLVKIKMPEGFLLDGNDLPKMDGAYALYPIYAALAQAMYPRELANDYSYVGLNGSDEIYRKLIDGKCDMIFALAPSKLQQEEAEKAGLTYEMTPFCRDAFVFYVNANNPIDNLTTEQIKAIYSGQVTNWRQIHDNWDTKIIAFQRNEGSGSQTTLQRLMGDTPIMQPLKEDRVGGMGDIINDTANYRNFRSALGFSFRFYATELLKNNKIKLLSIDGFAPTVENIRNESYPHIATAYIVTVRPRTENIRKITDFLLSPEGQELVEKTGYVPITNQDTSQVSVDYGTSQVHSLEEMDLAVATVKADFASMEGCKLYSLKYAGDERCRQELEYANKERNQDDRYGLHRL